MRLQDREGCVHVVLYPYCVHVVYGVIVVVPKHTLQTQLLHEAGLVIVELTCTQLTICCMLGWNYGRHSKCSCIPNPKT